MDREEARHLGRQVTELPVPRNGEAPTGPPARVSPVTVIPRARAAQTGRRTNRLTKSSSAAAARRNRRADGRPGAAVREGRARGEQILEDREQRDLDGVPSFLALRDDED